MDLGKFCEHLADHKYLNESLISEKEFNITVIPPDALALKLSSGKLSAVETVIAFIKKHLVVNNCTEVPASLENEFNAAFAMAGFLDCYYKSTGNTLGPLHGLPISREQLDGVKHASNEYDKYDEFDDDDVLDALGSIPLSIVFHATLAPISRPKTSIEGVRTRCGATRNLAVHSGV
ncbi:hypothetical protein KGF57_000865 [Candida theae]|uniref:Uncharacterized protein n=1 Tax=Candida theae TaxID=1198502 RepID=A0AAD5BIB0_9ASCO|nr:uncharacterized protein KGF57_000865 [Candida theae]KAI5965072.1 hypothetical protein KGF57_000865 [Candida theae]